MSLEAAKMRSKVEQALEALKSVEKTEPSTAEAFTEHTVKTRWELNNKVVLQSKQVTKCRSFRMLKEAWLTK